MEIIKNDVKRGNFKAVLFDFDGTISLIREGWQGVMIPYFIEVLLETPGAEDKDTVASCIRDFVDLLTGKQTIYQCIHLAKEVEVRGGKPEEPLVYKKEYHQRLMNRIEHRRKKLETGEAKPEEMVVPGSIECLQRLRDKDLKLYLASGTDESYVFEEAELLGITGFFNGGIYGAKDDYKLFSKAMIIQKILEDHRLQGIELAGFGDGYVEIENIKSANGLAVGVASDEARKTGIDEWKRDRLIKAGANAIIPDFTDTSEIMDYLFPGGK